VDKWNNFSSHLSKSKSKSKNSPSASPSAIASGVKLSGFFPRPNLDEQQVPKKLRKGKNKTNFTFLFTLTILFTTLTKQLENKKKKTLDKTV
jgi:hypothetical protein